MQDCNQTVVKIATEDSHYVKPRFGALCDLPFIIKMIAIRNDAFDKSWDVEVLMANSAWGRPW